MREPVNRQNTRWRRCGGAALVVPLLTAMATLTVAGGAAARPADPAAPGDLANDVGVAVAQSREQAPLVKAAKRIELEVRRGEHDGYAGIALPDRTVTLYWKGAVPAVIDNAVREARRTVPVVVKVAPYSLRELRAAAAMLEPRVRAGAVPFHAIEIPVEGTGLRLVTDQTGPLADVTAAGTDVSATVIRASRPELTSRENDYSPWWGGAVITNYAKRSRCSSGFAVRVGSVHHMLTSAHCGGISDYITDGSEYREPIGVVTHENWRHDVMLVKITNGSGGGHIYDDWGDGSAHVVDWDPAFPDEFVCQAGHVTKLMCRIQISHDFTAVQCFHDDDNDYICVNDLVKARQIDEREVGQPGDSGGPVFTYLDSDSVVAKGTNTARLRSWLWFQDFQTAVWDLNISSVVT